MKKNFDYIKFVKRVSIEQIEEGIDFCPKFNDEGLLPCITIENKSKIVLMFSFVNEFALKKTIASGRAHYYSRSRNSIWLKGEKSGMSHQVTDIFVDDDQDCIVYEVVLNKPTKGGKEASCHVGYKSCFYRKLEKNGKDLKLKFTESKKSFDPEIIYQGEENPTKI